MFRKGQSLFIAISILIPALVYAQPVFAADSLSISASTSIVRYESNVTISGTLSSALPGKTILLKRKVDGSTSYTDYLTGTTDASGNYSFIFMPDKSARYSAYYNESSVSSDSVGVKVVPKISIYRPRKAWVGQKIKIYGRLNPRLKGRLLALQRYYKGRWRTFARTKTNKYGGYKFVSNLNEAASYNFKVNYGGETLFSQTATSTFKVKTKWRNPFKISAEFKNYIVVNKRKFMLYYLKYGKVIKSFRCGIGMSSYPTPSGNFEVTAKRFHPTWYNPNASWSKNMPPSIPWPSSPLGVRALNISAPGIRIHGTTQPWLLDKPNRAVSHGCIRLKNAQITWLYNRVSIGTKVKIY